MISDIKGADFLALVVDDVDEESSIVLVSNRKNSALLVLLNVVHPKVSANIFLPEYLPLVRHIILSQLEVLICI